jgi:hypothetical protein
MNDVEAQLPGRHALQAAGGHADDQLGACTHGELTK